MATRAKLYLSEEGNGATIPPRTMSQPICYDRRLRQWLSDTWVVVDLSLPGWAYPITDRASRWVKTLIALTSNARLTLHRLEGQGPTGSLTAAYLGNGRSLDYLMSLLYEGPGQRHPAGQVALPRLRQTVATLRADHDLIFVELPYSFLLGWSGQNGVTTMPWLRQVLPLSRPWSQIEANFHKGKYQSDVRRIRKYGLTYRISRNLADFDRFYYQMYLPYITHRFGRLTAISSYGALKTYFDRGWLLQALEGQQVIAAELQYERDNVYYMRSMGILGGDSDLLRHGVSGAIYYYSIQEAIKRGCRAVDFGLTRPLLNDGVLRYKCKWGPVVSHGRTLYQGLWVCVGGNGLAATGFLARHPLAWMDSTGRWHGLVLAQTDAPLTTADVKSLLKEYWIPGLETIVVVAPAGFSRSVSLERITGPVPHLGPAVHVMAQTRPIS